MNANDMEFVRCVSYHLRRHGAYDLAGRVEASFYLDSLLLSHQGESKMKKSKIIEALIFARKNEISLTAMDGNRGAAVRRAHAGRGGM